MDELIASNALGGGGNPARIIALHAGLNETVSGLTIDRQCVGGLDAILIADALIRSGHCNVVVAGGVESYSRRPDRYKTFADGRPPEKYEQAQFTPWADRDPDMAQAASDLAERLRISRLEQDRWAVSSHARARCAPRDHFVEIGGVTDDGFTRSLNEKHCKRAPIVCGSVTAANMSVAADGAAFVVLASATWAFDRELEGVRVLGGQTLGGNPVLPGLAPISAIRRSLDRTNLTMDDLTSIEIMEAFAVQAIACTRGVGANIEKVNQWGGSLAWGHPIGASGAVIATQLFHQLKTTGGPGLAAIAAAGGLGTSLVLDAG